jgi:hypothetical protein
MMMLNGQYRSYLVEHYYASSIQVVYKYYTTIQVVYKDTRRVEHMSTLSMRLNKCWVKQVPSQTKVTVPIQVLCT